jgi:hypothetical protein
MKLGKSIVIENDLEILGASDAFVVSAIDAYVLMCLMFLRRVDLFAGRTLIP